MIKFIFAVGAALMMIATSWSYGQTAPICPVNPFISLIAAPAPFTPTTPVSSSLPVALAIRQLRPGTGADWDFVLQNPVISGNQITGDAPGLIAPTGFIPIPIRYAVFGPIAAGNYTITVRPIATNVTPNVACPLLTIPLALPQGFVDVPVPAIHGKLAALLAGLVVFTAALALRRRKRQV